MILKGGRLVYLWMAMNGLYTEISEHIRRRVGLGRPYRKEAKKLMLFLRTYGLGDQFHGSMDRTYRKLVDEVAAVLCAYSGEVQRHDLEEGPLADAVRAAIYNRAPTYDITPYGYVITSLSYHYRCKLFHGARPLPLYAHGGEHDIRRLRICNDLLEEFLDRNLLRWFDEGYRREHLLPEIERVAARESRGCNCL